MRVFYVLPITHPKAAAYLDGIRFICNSREKTLSHITIRGPYRQHYRLDRAQTIIEGALIRVEGAGTFFSDRQNTVFLCAYSETLKLVWHKPDYGDFHPHITLYDGHSRSFAQDLISILNSHPVRFAFRAHGLEPLKTSPGQSDSFLQLRLKLPLLSAAVEQNLTIDKIMTANESTRLEWIERIVQRLAGSIKSNPRTLQRSLKVKAAC